MGMAIKVIVSVNLTIYPLEIRESDAKK